LEKLAITKHRPNR